jgi:hypothetical protein
MSAYRRINIDGKSVTETRKLDAAVYPGQVVAINGDDEFAVGNSGRIYVVHPANHEGLSITDQIPATSSAVGEYIEEGRELVFRVPTGSYKKDDPIHITSSGVAGAVPGAAGTYAVVGYAQEDLTVGAASTDYLRVRIRAGSVTVSG